jgi:RNA polymerase sigma factor for flagellar operon FliA
LSSVSDSNKLTEEQAAELMAQFRQTGDVKLRNQLVMNYSYIPKSAAMQLRGLAQGYAQIEDMVSNGMVTLIDCIEKYDGAKGMKFDTYAFMRVRGGIIDLVRKQDWVPRRVRQAAKSISAATTELFSELKRKPTEEELAARLGIPVAKLRQSQNEVDGAVTYSFEEIIQNLNQKETLLDSATSDYSTPEKQFLKNELREKIKAAIESLSERERLVVTLYYYENLNLSEIAQVLEISVQRVSQISSRAVSKMKAVLEDYLDGNDDISSERAGVKS